MVKKATRFQSFDGCSLIGIGYGYQKDIDMI